MAEVMFNVFTHTALAVNVEQNKCELEIVNNSSLLSLYLEFISRNVSASTLVVFASTFDQLFCTLVHNPEVEGRPQEPDVVRKTWGDRSQYDVLLIR